MAWRCKGHVRRWHSGKKKKPSGMEFEVKYKAAVYSRMIDDAASRGYAAEAAERGPGGKVVVAAGLEAAGIATSRRCAARPSKKGPGRRTAARSRAGRGHRRPNRHPAWQARGRERSRAWAGRGLVAGLGLGPEGQGQQYRCGPSLGTRRRPSTFFFLGRAAARPRPAAGCLRDSCGAASARRARAPPACLFQPCETSRRGISWL